MNGFKTATATQHQVNPRQTGGINLFVSHDLEAMAARLVESLRHGHGSSADPFIPETILVQSKGMQRWLSMKIADALGICCNVIFPFPNPFLYGSLVRKLTESKEEWHFPYDRESMGWAILEIFSGCLDEPWAVPVRRYAGHPASPASMYQLAMQTARVFDGYLMFRPEMILGWDRGENPVSPEDIWQAELWRRLTTALGGTHRAAAITAFIDRLSKISGAPDDFPSRISFFGVTALPELHVRAFEAAARFVETDIYLCLLTSRPGEFWEFLCMDPDAPAGPGDFFLPGAWRGPHAPLSREFFRASDDFRGNSVEVFPYQPALPGFAATDRKKGVGRVGRGRGIRRHQTAGSDASISEKVERIDPDSSGRIAPSTPDSASMGENPLYGSMGNLGTEFAISIARLAAGPAGLRISHMLDRPLASTVLQLLQWDVHTGVKRGTTPGFPRLPMDPLDRSIRVHSCHGAMREVEVLKENLTGFFEDDPDLSPSDVVVMAPDISVYAPFVTAVFTSAGGAPDIPFTIADTVQEGGPATAFLNLLFVVSGRLKAPEVLGLLEHESIRSRFGLVEHDLERISRWVDEARIRWGSDKGHLEFLDLPGNDANTWEAGLARLALSVAVPGGEGRIWNGCAPHQGFEGDDSIVLGKFIDFARMIQKVHHGLRGMRSAGEWAGLLAGFWRDAVNAGGKPRGRAVDKALADLGAGESIRGCGMPIPHDVAISHIESLLGEESQGLGYLSGCVTFCSLKPMRGIPFRVVWLLGMDTGSFPGRDSQPGFDLAARKPRPGDRSRRGDDKYLFLEAFMAAREKFCVSYSGQSREEPSESPPSVLVSELLDYIDEAFFVQSGNTGGEKTGIFEKKATPSVTLTIRHPMQPFSPRYFNGREPDLISFSSENRLASLGVGKPAQFRPGLFDGPIEVPDTGEAGIEELADFFVNPSRFALRHFLGFEVRQPGAGLKDEEPFLVMENLEKYSLIRSLTEAVLRGSNPEALHEWAVAAGLLPHGVQGEVAWAEMVGVSINLAERVVAAAGPGPGQNLDVDAYVGGFRIHGRISATGTMAAVRYRPSKIAARDLARGWIQHLAMMVSGAESPESTVVLGIGPGSLGFREFGPVDNPERILGSLVELYRLGRREPLPFFPESSRAYSECAMKGSDHLKAFAAASKVWKPSSSGFGPAPESYDPSFSICFPGDLPDCPLFKNAALTFWGPIATRASSKGVAREGAR